jgi:hypothetical protein
MGDVVRFRRPTATEKAQGKTLCKHGFHKWRVWKDKDFDVRQGRLVTVFRCARCNATKSKAI